MSNFPFFFLPKDGPYRSKILVVVVFLIPSLRERTKLFYESNSFFHVQRNSWTKPYTQNFQTSSSNEPNRALKIFRPPQATSNRNSLHVPQLPNHQQVINNLAAVLLWLFLLSLFLHLQLQRYRHSGSVNFSLYKPRCADFVHAFL